MTLKQLEAIPREYLVAKEIGSCLGIGPQDIRDTIHNAIAQHKPIPFDFPVVICKQKMKFPKEAFLKYMKGEIQ